MAFDIPQFSNLCLIGYSRAQYSSGQQHVNLRDGYPGRWRNSITVSAETPVSLSFSGGSRNITLLGGKLKLTINGNTINCMFYNECGFYANSQFSLVATTAGNDVLQGCTVTKTITVLIFGKDNPHLNGNFFQFQVGQMVEAGIGGNFGHYADDPDKSGGGVCYPVQGGYSGGTAIGNANGVASGLVFMNRDGNIKLTGIAGRPGLYAVHITNKTNGPQAGGIFYPFWGDSADDIVIISIYQRYHVGDLALIIPSDLAGFSDGNALKLIHYGNYDGLPFTYPYVYRATYNYNAQNDYWQGEYVYPNGQISEHYQYRITPTRASNSAVTTGNWKFQARWFLDGSASTSWTLYDNAPCRGLIDEKPPKNGWGKSATIFTGGDLKYIDGNGFFSYAGTKIVSVDNQQYPVKYYQQQTMYTPQYTGWSNRPPQYQYGQGKYIYQNPITGNWNIVQGVVFSNGDGQTVTVQNIQSIAVPVAPPKKGDVILQAGGVAHSLNKKPQTGNFCLSVNGASFGIWEHYHILRLLNPETVSGTMTATGNFRKTNEYCEYQVWSGLLPPETQPDSVENILLLSGNQDTCQIMEGYNLQEIYVKSIFTASLEQNLSLRHKYLNSDGEELAEILNCKAADHPVIDSQGDDVKQNWHYKHFFLRQRYTVYRPEGDQPVDDTDYNFHWEITSGSFSLTHHSYQEWHNIYVDDQGHEHPYTDYRDETRRVSGTWSKQGGEHITEDIEIVTAKSGYKASAKTTTNHGTSRGLAGVGWSVSGDGTVSVSGGWFNVSASSTGKYTASCSGSNNGDTVTVSATAEQIKNDNWDYGYSYQRQQQHPGIEWDYMQTYEEKEQTDIWQQWTTDNTAATEGGLFIGGKVWFGCGRQSNNAHDVCAAGFNAWANAGASGRKTINCEQTNKLTARYLWRRSVDSDSQVYDYEDTPYESTSTVQTESTSWTVGLSGGSSGGLVTFQPGGAVSMSGKSKRQTKNVSGHYSWSCWHEGPGWDDQGSTATVTGNYYLSSNSATSCPDDVREGESNSEYDAKRSQARDIYDNIKREIPLHSVLSTNYDYGGYYSEQTQRVNFRVSVGVQT